MIDDQVLISNPGTGFPDFLLDDGYMNAMLCAEEAELMRALGDPLFDNNNNGMGGEFSGSDDTLDNKLNEKQVVIAAQAAAGLSRSGLKRAAFSMNDLTALQPNRNANGQGQAGGQAKVKREAKAKGRRGSKKGTSKLKALDENKPLAMKQEELSSLGTLDQPDLMPNMHYQQFQDSQQVMMPPQSMPPPHAGQWSQAQAPAYQHQHGNYGQQLDHQGHPQQPGGPPGGPSGQMANGMHPGHPHQMQHPRAFDAPGQPGVGVVGSNHPQAAPGAQGHAAGMPPLPPGHHQGMYGQPGQVQPGGAGNQKMHPGHANGQLAGHQFHPSQRMDPGLHHPGHAQPGMSGMNGQPGPGHPGMNGMGGQPGPGSALRRVASSPNFGKHLENATKKEGGLGHVGGVDANGTGNHHNGAADGRVRIGTLTLEERRARILRYRQKRHERNFRKRIKYNCRKTLADSRPRIRGRFARNDEIEELLKQKKLQEQKNSDSGASSSKSEEKQASDNDKEVKSSAKATVP